MLSQKHPEAVGYTPLNLYKSSLNIVSQCTVSLYQRCWLTVFEQFQITHIGVVL